MNSYYKIGLVCGAEDPPKEKSGSTWIGVGIAAGLMALIYGSSPGARHYYKHGKLPP